MKYLKPYLPKGHLLETTISLVSNIVYRNRAYYVDEIRILQFQCRSST